MLAAAAFEGLAFLHEGLFDDCNEQMAKLLGGRRRELLKTPFLDCVSPEHRPAVTGILTQGKCGPCEFTALRRDGTAFAAEMQTRAAVIGGKAVRVVAVRDIGERKRAEEALRASEARLSKTTENAPAMIYQFLLRPDGSMCFPYASGWCQSIFGVNPEALRQNADALLERILPEDRPAFEASVARSAQTFEPWRHEFRLRSARGDIVWHQGISTPELQADGSILWSGIFFDTTERRRAEEALRVKTEELDRYFTSSLDLLCIADTDGYFRRLNPEWERTLGYAPDDLVGKRFLDLVHPEDEEATLRAVAQLAAQTAVQSFENRYRCKDGSYRWIEWRSLPVGKLIYAAARDITERKRAVEALRKSAHETEWLMKSMASAFVVWGTILDANGRLVDIRFEYFNDAYARVSGLKLDVVRGKTVREVWPNTEEGWFEVYGEVALSGESKSFEMYHDSTQGYYACTAYRPWDSADRICVVFEDITERRKAEERARKLADEQRVVLNTIATGITRLKDRKHQWANPGFARMFGYTISELPGVGTAAFYASAEDYERVGREGYAQLAAGNVYTTEALMRRKDGSSFWCSITGQAIDSQDLSVGSIWVLQDIAERKRSEEILRKSEAQLRGIAQNVPGMVFQYYARPNGEVGLHYVSDRAMDYLGLDNRCLEGLLERFIAGVAPEDRPGFLASIQAAIASVSRWEFEGRYIKPGGEEMYFRGVSQPRQLAQELVFDGLILDITERRRAEAALERERMFTNAVLDSVPGLLYLYDDQGRLLRWNKQHETLTGYSTEELARMTLLDWYRGEPEEAERIAAAVQRIPVEGHAEAEALLVTKSGQRIPFLFTAVNLRIDDHNYFVGIGINVTERRRAEEALRRSEANLQLALEAARLGDWSWDMVSGEIAWSARCKALYGLSPETVVTYERFLECLHPEDRDRIDAALRRAVEVRSDYEVEKRAVWPDGSVHWNATRGRVFCNAAGEPVRVAGVTFDISERKRAESALRENEERLRLALAGTNQGLYDLNLQTGEAVVSPEYVRMLGYESGEVAVNAAWWRDQVHPDDLEMAARTLGECLKGQRTEYRMEYRLKHKSGEWRWVLSLGRVVEVDAQGQPVRMLGTHTDVTERHQAEEALRRSEAGLEAAQAQAHIGNWSLDLVRGMGLWSKEMYRLCERDPALGPPSLAEFLEMVHPADRGVLQATHQRVVETGEPYRGEFRARLPGGSVRHFSTTIEILEDRTNHLPCLAGTLQDITERKQAEEALTREHELLRTLIDLLPDGIYVKDRDSRFLLANRTLAERFGKTSPQEVVGLSDHDLFPAETADTFRADEEKVVAGDVVLEKEEHVVFPNGLRRTVLTTKVPLRDKEGRITGLVGVGRDITERVLAEAAAKETQERLGLALEGADLGSWDWNVQTGEININDRWAQMLGYRREEIEPHEKSWEALVHPDDLPKVLERLQAHLDGRTPFYETEHRMRQKSGGWVWVLDRGRVIARDADGKAIRAVGTHLDITERKRIEETLLRVHKAVECASDAIGMADAQGRHFYQNKAFTDLFEYTAEEINATDGKPAGYVDPDAAREVFATIMAGGSWSGELEMQSKSGRRFLVRMRADAIKDEAGRVIGLVGVHTDITERKRAEEALRESEQRFRAVVENAQAIIFMLDRHGVFRLSGGGGLASLGLRPDQVVGQSALELYGDSPSVLEGIKRALAGESNRKVNRLGDLVFDTVYSPYYTPEGQQDGVVGIAIDITERTRAEAAAKESQERLALALEGAALGSWDWNVQTGELRFNERWVQMLGLRLDEVRPEAKTWETLVHPDDLPGVLQVLQAHLDGRTVAYETEHRMRHANGDWIWVLDRGRVITRDEAGKPIRAAGTHLDITERKRIEAELVGSRQMLRTVLDTIPTRVFWKDRNLVYAGCNRAFAQDHGFAESAAIIGKTDLETMTAVFAERYRADDRQVIATGQSKLGYEEPQIRADGQQGWLLTNKVPMHDSRGQVVGVLGTYEDITERKRIEAALRESEERFRQMFERNRAMMLLVEPESGAIADANPAAAEFYGYPRGVLCRMGIEEINTMPRDQVKVAREAAVAGEMEDFVFPHRLASGEIRTVEVRSSPVNVGGRRLLFSIIQDITERKRAEAALEKRIVALTQPLDSPAGIAFEELFNLADIQQLQDLFAEACAVASIITHPDGTPITRPSNFCKLCSEVIRKTEKGLKNCYCSDAILGRQHESGPIIQPCLSGGLWDAGASITVGGRHVANWLIGQVRNEAQSEEHMMAYAREIGADDTAFREAFRAVPVMSRERFEQVAQALFAVASQLSTSAYQNVQQARFIAERKRAEDALAQERELLATVINLLPDSVYVKDRDCRFLLANQTLIARLGKSSPSEVLGLSDRDFFPPEEAARFRADEEPVLAGEVVSEQESRTVLPTGVTLTLLNTKVPLRNRQGDIVGLVGVGRDITERKRVEEEREHLIRELEAKNAELERFTYTVSHDLKSPLITIKGFAGALLQDVAVGRQERVQHDLQRISAATDKMADLLKDLLELSRIGRMMNPPTDVKLDKLVPEVLELLAGIIQQRPIQVTVQPGLPTVRGDRRRLTEVFQNLIENAVRFLGDQAQPCIEIGVRGEGAERVFFVRDNGMGIEPRYHETVFGLFNKLDARTPGTGIGLALVRRIVEVHGGRIWVESAGARQGATFCFTLPSTPPIRKDTQS